MNILNCTCGDNWRGYAPLVLRVATGLIFFMHGWQKLTQFGLDGVTGMLGGMGFPMPAVFAALLIAAEVLGGLALILGVFTHWAAKILVIVSLVAWIAVHLKGGFFLSNGGYEFIMLLFAASFSLMITGPGKFALGRAWYR